MITDDNDTVGQVLQPGVKKGVLVLRPRHKHNEVFFELSEVGAGVGGRRVGHRRGHREVLG